MHTMNISLSDADKSFVEEQVGLGSYVSSSDFFRDLLRKERDRLRLRNMLLEGVEGGSAGPADDAYFEDFKQRIRDAARKRGHTSAA